MRASYLSGIACLCFVSACGGGREPSSLNMNGRWSFSATPAVAFPVNETAMGQLTQNGNSVTGIFALTQFPCAASATLTGTVTGTMLSLQFNENGQSVVFTGKVNSKFTFASGRYFAPSGGCTNGETGMWFATKG